MRAYPQRVLRRVFSPPSRTSIFQVALVANGRQLQCLCARGRGDRNGLALGAVPRPALPTRDVSPQRGCPEAKGFPLPSSSSRRPPQQLAPVARPWGFAMSSRADGCWKAGTAGHTLLRVPVTSGSGVPALVFAHRKGMQKAAPSLQSCAPRPSPSTGHGSSAGPERCLSRVLATAGGTGQPGGQGWPPALPLALPLAGSTLIHAYMRLYILIDADRPLWRLLLLLLP